MSFTHFNVCFEGEANVIRVETLLKGETTLDKTKI